MMNFHWQLRGSRLRGLWYGVLVLGAVLLSRSFAGVFALAPLLAVAGSLLWYEWRQRRLGLSALGYHQGSWTVVSRGRSVRVGLASSHFPAPRFGVMEFSAAGVKPLRLVLWPDSLSGDGFRELRLALA